MEEETIFNTLSSKRSEKADRLHRLFMEFGIDFATGVPCGVLRHIIKNFKQDSRVHHISVNRESEAVGVAAGAYLCGKMPVVYMQNSGLFGASNDIASLLIPYEIPVFFVVSYRGCDGETAPQHIITGGATEKLIKSFGLPYAVFDGTMAETDVRALYSKMLRKKVPAVMLLKRGWHR